MMKHTQKTTGALVRVEPMPPAHLIEQASDEVREAVEDLRKANEVSVAAMREASAVQKERNLAEVPSEIVDLDDKVFHARNEEAAKKREAQRAGGRLAKLLDQEADDLGRKGARSQVERHVAMIDAYVAFQKAAGSDLAPGPKRSPQLLMPWVETSTQAQPRLADVGRYLDETNVPDLLEAAGMTAEEAGLVEVYKVGMGARSFLTTRERAAFLPSGFAIAGEEDA